MNALTILALLVLALIGAGCDSAPAHDVTVADVRGQCWTLAGTDGIRYAVKAEQGAKLGLKPGQKITIRGKVASKQDCAAAVVLDAEVR